MWGQGHCVPNVRAQHVVCVTKTPLHPLFRQGAKEAGGQLKHCVYFWRLFAWWHLMYSGLFASLNPMQADRGAWGESRLSQASHARAGAWGVLLPCGACSACTGGGRHPELHGAARAHGVHEKAIQIGGRVKKVSAPPNQSLHPSEGQEFSHGWLVCECSAHIICLQLGRQAQQFACCAMCKCLLKRTSVSCWTQCSLIY